MNANVLIFPRKPQEPEHATDQALAKIKAGFDALVREPLAVNPESPGGKGSAFGPYNMPIFYLPDGAVWHSAAQYTAPLRQSRKFTCNAIELRCDALGLAIYVAGTLRIEKEGLVKQGARIAVYDYNNVEPTTLVVVPNAAALSDKLHTLLLNTYNSLARKYNLAGLSKEWLVLKSDTPQFPDIHLIP